TEQYWNKNGDIKHNRFTCEDFAIRLLCEYACQHGLPVKLTTGVRTYRNEEPLRPGEHERYGSSLYGFTEMVMLSYGAPDMQRVGVNTVAVSSADELHAGDVLAQARDRNNSAHHIQVVVMHQADRLSIYQGNSGIGNVLSLAYRAVLKNPADPQDGTYTGQPIEIGEYTKVDKDRWRYENKTVGTRHDDFLKLFMLYRWNFMGFNS
ncbi:hypothetical protein, partial [Aquabacterium sp.]|uniref:hypothetical protein n=1 Tax=Aquabacterium sp. TaxID=1872578 RepID=UPI0035B2C0C8